jgi:membrane protein
MQLFAGILPAQALNIFNAQLQEVAGQQQTTLTAGAAIGLLLALWSARSAMSALMMATNVAYNEHEKRGFFTQIAISLALTVGAILGFLAMLIVGVALPTALKVLGTSPWVQAAAAALRWLLLWLFAVIGLAFVYRYAPAREPARWHWVSWGSAITAALWLAASALLSFYLRTCSSCGKTYGALGGVIALLLWFYVSSLVVVLGAEINAEMERQTFRDTTSGPELPMGRRGAYAADTVGPSARGVGGTAESDETVEAGEHVAGESVDQAVPSAGARTATSPLPRDGRAESSARSDRK